MSLLREIQNAAIDGGVKLQTLLRKCKVLAARLGNDEFSQWVDAELTDRGSTRTLAPRRYRRSRPQHLRAHELPASMEGDPDGCNCWGS